MLIPLSQIEPVCGLASDLRSYDDTGHSMLQRPIFGAGDQFRADALATNLPPNNKTADFGAALCLKVANDPDIYPTDQVTGNTRDVDGVIGDLCKRFNALPHHVRGRRVT